MEPKLFIARIEERNNGKEYTYFEYIIAPDQPTAEKWAEDYVKNWYSAGKWNEEEQVYEIEYEGISWHLAGIGDCTQIPSHQVNTTGEFKGKSYILEIKLLEAPF